METLTRDGMVFVRAKDAQYVCGRCVLVIVYEPREKVFCGLVDHLGPTGLPWIVWRDPRWGRAYLAADAWVHVPGGAVPLG